MWLLGNSLYVHVPCPVPPHTHCCIHERGTAPVLATPTHEHQNICINQLFQAINMVKNFVKVEHLAHVVLPSFV